MSTFSQAIGGQLHTTNQLDLCADSTLPQRPAVASLRHYLGSLGYMHNETGMCHP